MTQKLLETKYLQNVQKYHYAQTQGVDGKLFHFTITTQIRQDWKLAKLIATKILFLQG